MNEDWIALFQSDYSARIFTKPGTSKDIIYWIKRFPNGKTYQPSSTINIYKLRDFEFYDTQLLPTSISHDLPNKWECLGVTEFALDTFGSYCSCSIKDSNGKIHDNINIFGQVFVEGGYQKAVSQHLFFPVIMFFLKFLSQYKNWDEVNLVNKDIINGKGIPVELFEKVVKRDNYLKDLDIT